MRRSAWKAAVAAAALALTLSGAAAAAPPASAGGPNAAAGHGAAASGQSLGVGQQVAAAVQAALASGASGTAVAEAVHAVILAEKPNAQGLTVAMAVYAAAQGGTTPSGPTFSDLSQTPWGQSAVDALAQAGVVDGTGSGQFAPDQPVTEAELATMLSRLQSGTAPTGQQVPSGTPSWAQGPMAWAEAGGVFANEQGLTAPDAPLTRAQAVLMLINAAGLGDFASQQSGASIALSGDVPAWAHGALALAIQLGLLQGSGGQLLADQPLTRAQMAVLLARLAVLEASATTASGG